MVHWTIEKTLADNPRARLLQDSHPEAALLAYAHDRIYEELRYLAAWRKDPAANRSHPLHHDVEGFFADVIDKLIDAGAGSLSQRFNEYAQAVHESQKRARLNPDAPATPDYITDAPTALHEYDARMDELRRWCIARLDAIFVGTSNMNASGPMPHIDTGARTITMNDGSVHALANKEQCRVVSRIISARGGWIVGPEIRDPDYPTERVDRIVKRLPEAVQRHIESGGSKGYRWVT